MAGHSADVVEGDVTESLPNALYRVVTDAGHELTVHLSSRSRLELVRILPGDRVKVEVSPLDRTRGRITSRVSRGS